MDFEVCNELKNELDALKEIRRTRDIKVNFLSKRYPEIHSCLVFSANPGRGRELRFLESKEVRLALYTKANDRLNRLFPLAIQRTPHEWIFEDLIKRRWKFRIEKSLWIGPYCCDLFIPAVKGIKIDQQTSISGGRVSNGLVIEVNGKIHDDELKMRKDFSKERFLSKLGIAVLSVENNQCSDSFTRNIVRSIGHCKRPDSRAIERLWRKIHLETIIAGCTPEEIGSLFDFSELEVRHFKQFISEEGISRGR